MNYRLRDHATKILKLHAEILSEIEAMIEEQSMDGDAGLTHLTKLQFDQVHWQRRFTHLTYITGEVQGE